MKQFSLLTIPLLCAAVSPLSADAMGKSNNKTYGKQTQQPQQQQQPGQITPSANPQVTHACDPYFTADFIWWKAREDGLIYAFNGASTTSGISASTGRAYQPDFSYEPGFKVGFGLKFKHDGWDTYANYTWLRNYFSETKDSVNTTATSTLFSNYFVIGGSVPTFARIDARASSEWSLSFNVLDLELGRDFWISQWLTLRPHVGLKWSWNDQEFDVRYDSATISGLTGSRNVYIDNDLDQWAGGIRTGLDTAWFMWKKWCIFGDFAISAMYNDFDVKRKDRISNAQTTYTSLSVKRNSFHALTAVVEWALGLRFETPFHNDDYLFKLQAGWEEQIWFNQNRFFFIADEGSKDLTLQGLTAEVGFDF